jgi:hypothetical protein
MIRSGVKLLHLAKVKWLSEGQLSNGILLQSNSQVRSLSAKAHTHSHVLAEEAFASNTSHDSLFSGVQGFISSIMDSTDRLSSVCSDLVSNARRMPLLRVCQ